VRLSLEAFQRRSAERRYGCTPIVRAERRVTTKAHRGFESAQDIVASRSSNVMIL
jgi:hypothetical protein